MAAINNALPMIKGFKLRATRVGRCGLPIPGPGNVFVTDGFIEFGLETETADGNDIEVTNASGQICATDRTDDQFKRYNTTLQLCGVHPELVSMFTDQPLVTDADGDAVGILQQTGGNSDAGVALELWIGAGGGDDCEVPEGDSIFDSVSDGESNFSGWYLLLPWVRGARLGDFTINGTDAADITITGYTGSGANWGRGPYNVVTDGDGEPARLLAPIPARTHSLMQTTTVRPPENTNGAVELSIPQPYFSSTDAPAADRAEEEDTLEEGEGAEA